MKTILFLTMIILATVAQAEDFTFKVNEAVRCGGSLGKVVAISPTGKYVVNYTAGNYAGKQMGEFSGSEIAKTFGTGKTSPRFRIDESVRIGDSRLKVVGILSNGKYLADYESGNYVGKYAGEFASNEIAKTKGCGTTTPRFCYDMDIMVGSSLGKIKGILSTGSYIADYVGGAYDRRSMGEFKPSEMIKLVPAGGNKFTCDNVDGIISESTEDIMAAYSGLATLTTAEKAEYLKTISKYLVTTNRADTNIFARFTFGKLVKMSTAKMVQDAFGKTVADDQAALAKEGWKTIDQIEANVYTLDFAMRILQAGIKLRMTMPNANASIQAYLPRLASIAGEQQLSKKLIGLSAFVQDLQPLLQELIQDPRQQSLGMLTADVAGWISKN